MRQIAAIAAAIMVAALVVALVSWRMFLRERPGGGAAAAGIALAPAAGRGLLIDGLACGGPADRAGLRVGDLVRTVNGANVAGMAAADRALESRTVDIGVRRGDKALLIRLPPAHR